MTTPKFASLRKLAEYDDERLMSYEFAELGALLDEYDRLAAVGVLSQPQPAPTELTEKQIRNLLTNTLEISFNGERYGARAMANDIYAALVEYKLLRSGVGS